MDYTLRAPSVGSSYTGSGDSERGTPKSNEWDKILDKDDGYIKNWREMLSCGQDTTIRISASSRAVRGWNRSARFWTSYNTSLVYYAYDEPFLIEPNGEYIVYAMLVDASLNIIYLRSDRITLDNVLPVIGGIEDGKTYCEAQTVTINEKYIETVTVNGTAVELDKNNSFILPAADGEQKIVAADKAGNIAEMTVTVHDGHTFGDWKADGDGTHSRECTVDGCKGVETMACSGGNATCTEKPICEICKGAYGKLDPNNHADLMHISAKAATEDTEGNIEYWYCGGCDKYYSDKDGINEIKKADTVTARIKGNFKSPRTGNASDLGLWVALLFVSGGVLTGVTVFDKRKRHSAK